MLVYLVSVLRARAVSFIVLVYNVAAKEELLSRGLLPQEVYNFHSYLYRQYTQVIRATLTENCIMMQVWEACTKFFLIYAISYFVHNEA